MSLVLEELLLGIIICCLLQFTSANTNYGLMLTQNIMANYTPMIRPKTNISEPVEVYLAFELRQILELDERKQVLISSGFFVSRWFDDFLVWEPEEYGGMKEIVLPPSAVWVPDFGIENSAHSFYKQSYRESFNVRVRHDGFMQWSFGGEIATVCALDVTMFPFDTQKCALIIENWAYTGDEVILHNGTDVINMDVYTLSGVWDVIKTQALSGNHYYDATDNVPFSEVEFIIHLERKPAYYILNLVLPCILIIIVALCVNWVPAESGEKVSLAVTVLLAFSVFQLVIKEQMPINSDDTSMLGNFVVSLMALSAISTLVAIWVLYLSLTEQQYPIPACIKTFTFKYMARILCMNRSLPDLVMDHNYIQKNEHHELSAICNGEIIPTKQQDKKNDLTDMMSTVEKQLSQINDHLKFISSRAQSKDEDKIIMIEWREFAKVLDRLMFWLSVIALVAVVLVFTIQRIRININNEHTTNEY